MTPTFEQCALVGSGSIGRFASVCVILVRITDEEGGFRAFCMLLLFGAAVQQRVVVKITGA
jgi:hypothetical protein